MNTPDADLSIIMPCHDRGHHLVRILRAYERQTSAAAFEIVAVDDASSDDTPRVLQQFLPERFHLRYVRLPLSSGPAAARNVGLALARAPLVAFVGDDICPAADFVAAHVYAHRVEPGETVAVLGRTIWPVDLPQNTLMTHIDGVGAQQFSYHNMHDDQFYDYRHLYASNVSLKRSLLERQHSRFDESFRSAAFEDAELGWRLERIGLRIRYRARILATHYHYSTIWTFTERQYRCGQMSWHLIRKHPRAFTHLTDLKQFRLILRSLLQSGNADPESAAALEVRGLAIAAQHEWLSVPGLDLYYYELLQYFYYKGLLSAMCGHRTDLTFIQARHAQFTLSPAVEKFLTASDHRNS